MADNYTLLYHEILDKVHKAKSKGNRKYLFLDNITQRDLERLSKHLLILK